MESPKPKITRKTLLFPLIGIAAFFLYIYLFQVDILGIIATAQRAASPNRADQQPRGLLPFAGDPRQGSPKGLPFRLTDYLALVDWSGRLLREDKRGAINAKLPPLLVRLDIDARQWRYLTTRFESHFKHLVGTVHALRRACHSLNRNWVHGVTSARVLFESA